MTSVAVGLANLNISLRQVILNWYGNNWEYFWNQI